MDELSIAELKLLKETIDTLIEQLERLKEAQFEVGEWCHIIIALHVNQTRTGLGP